MPTSRNPYTEQVIHEYDNHSPQQVESKIKQAQHAFEDWRTRSVEERCEFVRQIGVAIRKKASDLAELATQEMGKPLSQSKAEVEKCALGCDFYADHGPAILAHETVETDASQSYVRFDPIGPVLAVMPWNFPFWQVVRFIAPALVAGNVGLLKHASNVTGCGLAVEALVRDAGLPTGCFTTVITPSEEVERIITHDSIRAVTLTGSEPAGRAVAAIAGKHLKKTVLELGGSDPFIVLGDADLDHTIPKAIKGRIQNAGQSCIAAKRFIVEQSIYDEFVERMVAGMEELKLGDPMKSATDMGPLARKDLVDDLHEQVEKSVSQGAKLVTGGKRPDLTGYFYEPTVLTQADREMTCFQEELFGPVASVAQVADADEAVKLANATRYGLGGSVWTSDLDRAQKLAAQLDTGNVFINEVTKSDPKVPFGGVKDSGYGRELSHYGLREFVNIKTVWVA